MLEKVSLRWRLAAAAGAALVTLSCVAGVYAATPSTANSKEDAAAGEKAVANAKTSDVEKADAADAQDLTLEGVLADAVETPAWVTDELSDCGVCHTRTADNPANDGYLYASHTAVSCFACHDDADMLTKRHENATQAKGEKLKKLKKTEINDEVRIVCHDQATLAEVTADCVVLTDKDGNVVNPHDVPANDRHDEAMTCGSCHKFHKDLDLQAQAFNFCVGCHHAAVFECGTCHE